MSDTAAHALSPSDRELVRAFERGTLTPAEFDHRAHVRLAYAYLAESNPDAAAAAMRQGLHGYLRHHGVDSAKYHETLTRAWILAVSYFMQRSSGAESADAFIDANPRLLDTQIMLTHYSASVLFSPEARARFVEPDLDPIPRRQ
jgi:hypothetical protein